MKQEMININANLLAEPTFSSFENEGEKVEVANFTLVKKYGKERSISIVQLMDKKRIKQRTLKKAIWFISLAILRSVKKGGKIYKNFVVKSYNKIEKKEENEEE